MDTTVNNSRRDKIAKGMSTILASTYALYLNTQNFHWNVTGPKFHQLHKMFEEQYEELASAIDEIAERVRVLGFKAPGSFDEFSKLSLVPQNKVELLAHVMISKLNDDHLIIARNANELASFCSESGDEGSADLLISRLRYHEKTSWMLNSFLQ
ncbi:DNA starvation/stationary phase protection protein [Bacteriovoracaceae bacterium]|nr:DNA starvation/stationary phase protection protein [Bacteriovoracaceae bacterium]